jgi:Cu/Ag efflux protein CusF
MTRRQEKLRLALFLISIITTFLLATTGRSEQATPSPRSPFAKGAIERIDPVHNTLTLKTRDGLQTFTWTERTYIFRGKEKISADKLKPGEIIALRFFTNEQGRLIAQRIKAAPAQRDASPNPQP